MSAVVDLQRMNGTNNVMPNSNHKSSLGIRGRLLIGFGAITIIFLLAIGITLSSVYTIKNNSTQVLNIELPTYDAILDLTNQIYNAHMNIQRVLLFTDNKYRTNLENTWVEIERDLIVLDDLSKKWTNSAYLKKWHELRPMITELKAAHTKVIDNINGTDKTAASRILEIEVMPIINKIGTELNAINVSHNQTIGLLDMISQQLHVGTQDILHSLDRLQIIQYILSIIAIIAAILIALFTARSIIRHINIFRQHSSRIVSGDLTQTIKVESYDELGQLGNDLNVMTQSLAAMTKEITVSCHNIVTTLDEVRHAVDAQSAGASEQASSINEITASLSEIEKSSAQTMDKAKSLGDAAIRTREQGQQGLEAVDQSIIGMKEVREKVQMIAQTILDLSHKTQQVGEITAVVNNLAQQSKMLALNASIEAAKAGEAGKGFEVVAVEVKTLAEQSEQATAQVQKILEDIRQAAEKAVMVTEEGTKGVDHGTSLVEQTGDVIRNLNDVIHETTIATQQIESAIRQEGAGIEQITTGMNEINQVTTSFVESVKQTTEAMDNLAAISKNLKAFVDSYKV